MTEPLFLLDELSDPLPIVGDHLTLAGDDGTHRYWHTVIPLDGADITPPETTLTGGPTGTTSCRPTSTTTRWSRWPGSRPGATSAGPTATRTRT